MSANFDPERIFAVLERHGVAYVVIGGVAAVLQGSPLFTQDVDICPRRDHDNLERLAKALMELGARIRLEDSPDGLPFACDAEFLGRMSLLNLITPQGPLDVAFEPSGTSGYEDLIKHARRLHIAPEASPVIASLEDVIRSKEAANRPKDAASLPTLRTLLAELRRRGDD